MWPFRQKRFLFWFIYNGKRKAVDPLRVYRALVMERDDFGEIVDGARKQQPASADKLAEIISQTFGIERFNPETKKGLTDLEILEIVDSFFRLLTVFQHKLPKWPDLWPYTVEE